MLKIGVYDERNVGLSYGEVTHDSDLCRRCFDCQCCTSDSGVPKSCVEYFGRCSCLKGRCTVKDDKSIDMISIRGLQQ